jgi:hypothetical protein
LAKLLDDMDRQMAELGLKRPKVVLVSPVRLVEASLEASGHTHSAAKSLELAPLIAELAQVRDCIFFDAAEVASVGADGLHISEMGHQALAEAFTVMLKRD